MNFALEINAGAWEASKSWGGGHRFRGALLERKGHLNIFKGNVGDGGREGKINAIINQRPLRPTHG